MDTLSGVDLKEIGRTVKVLRERAGLTQREVAERAGLANTWISDIERGSGDKSPTLRAIENIARAVGGLALLLVIPLPPADEAVQLSDDRMALLSRVALALARGDEEAIEDFRGAVRSLERANIAARA